MSHPFSPAAVRADRRVLRAAHPVAYPLVRGLARVGPALRVPGLGVVVNDPDLVRQVLVDTEGFRKDGPGSPGELWSPVVGPRALTNMEGPEHRRLRTALAGLFTAEHARALVAEAMSPGLARLAGRLAAGGLVDVAAEVRALVGAVVLALVGAPVPAGPDGERACRELVAQGERLTARVGLRTRALSPPDVDRALQVLSTVTGPAVTAWRRRQPDTVPGRMRDLGLDEQDAAGVAGVLFLTGTETVTSFLPRLVALLADSHLLAPHTAVTTARRLDELIEEALRRTAPTPATLRRAVAAARVGPVAVRPGERVLVMTLNAVSTHPPTTAELRHLWFGAGPHFCLGRPLALAEARALVTVLVTAVTDTGRELQVVGRTAGRRVLIPSWQRLTVRVA